MPAHRCAVPKLIVILGFGTIIHQLNFIRNVVLPPKEQGSILTSAKLELLSHYLNHSKEELQQQKKNDTKPERSRPMFHIVKTRFMQFQPILLALGHARLQLFETFCLPTMIHQSTDNFLWIIRTDPDLPDTLLTPLKEMLAPYSDRFYLVLSNNNTEGFRQLHVHDMRIVSGNTNILRQAIAESQDKWVIETRLDADDGLHRELLESIQQEAMEYYQQTKSQDNWRAYCVARSINWHSGALAPLKEAKDNATGTLNLPPQGVLTKNLPKSCITPGLSYILPPNVRQPPQIGHHVLHQTVPRCSRMKKRRGGGPKKGACFDYFNFDDWPQSIQARTMTSAGMGGFHKDYKDDNNSPQMWKLLANDFHISQEGAVKIIASFKENVVAIAKDNLAGQCTEDHTCSRFARKYLGRIVYEKERQEQREQEQKKLAATNVVRRV